MIEFEFHQPDSLEAALELLAKYDADAALIAGGTDLLIDMKKGEANPAHLISLWDVPDIGRVDTNGGLHIGTLTTITDLTIAASGQPSLQCFAEAARVFGGLQVQNAATVGGNICKASPAADMVLPLLSLDASLKIVGANGERQTMLEGFLIGRHQTALLPGEILTEINLMPVSPRTGTAFVKATRRNALDLSIVAVGSRVELDSDGKTCNAARIVVGAAAPSPFRAKAAEAVLEGQELLPEIVGAAAREARDEARPIDDLRGSADYRRMLVKTLVERAVFLAAERAARGENN